MIKNSRDETFQTEVKNNLKWILPKHIGVKQKSKYSYCLLNSITFNHACMIDIHEQTFIYLFTRLNNKSFMHFLLF